jgi:hypothetical protein
MKWMEKIKSRLIQIVRHILRILNMNIPVDNNTGLIDSVRIKNFCLHFDGESYYYTALIDGYLTFITYSNDLKNWLGKSGIAISDLSVIWEMDIPPDVTLLACENLPVTVVKSRFGFKK